ncbi:MAG TPA: transposase [Gemmatimonadales bacterium]|nr:transposase [Gemmatimonadales bacterium]
MAAGWLVARDELWELVEPLIPAVPAASTGRPRVPDRAAFGAIMFVLFTGTPWKQIPRELGCSGSTAHERFTAWARAGVFEGLHRELLRLLNAAGRIDWSAGVIDSTHIRALKGGT